MGLTVPTSSAYEAEANRVRGQIDETVRELRSRLTPGNLASEAAASVGLADISWTGALDHSIRRHPVPTTVAGLGLAAWALMAARNRSRSGGVSSMAARLRELSASIVESATRVFRERAELKRRELVRQAQAQVAAGAARLSDELERKLDDVVAEVPGGVELRPILASAIQIALTAALEGLLRKDRRDA